MSIERSTAAAPSHKATASAGSHGVKGKAHTAGDGSAAAAGDFSALLQQLGLGDEDVAPEPLALAGEGQSTDEREAEDGLPTPKVVPDVDAGLLLAQSLQLQPRPAAAPAGELKPSDTPEPGTSVPVAGSAEMPLQARAQEPGVAAVGKAVESFKPVLTEAVKDTVAKAVASRGTSRPGGTEASVVPAAASKTVAAMHVQPQQVLAELQLDASNPGLQQAVAVSGLGENGLRRAERVAEKSVFASAGNGEGWGQQMVTTTAREDGTSPLLDQAVVMTPELAVAEQVNYWISRDMQNAELKLDGLGASPVEVSISLQGNEAQVEFRTDQVEAREVLEGAVSHLKELLNNEGLVLSGVSVGSSGADGSAAQERKSRPNSRSAAVAVPQAQSVEAHVRPGRSSGRTVDLFV